MNEEKLLEYLKRTAADLRQARRRLRDAEERGREPVAIVGMGCRFPGGADTPEGLWDVVAGGVDAISGFPADRGWDTEEIFDPDREQTGKSYVRQGGFVADVAGFDAGFFGISPREAAVMDPQQRLLLEVCWEALERAGIDPVSLRGSATGVYAGAAYGGYGLLLGGRRESEGFVMAGNATSVLSGRVSYALGLEGPTLTVDTACSSSLVALHLACQALRAGECDLALAGGVTVMATPDEFVVFSGQRVLAPDGRCKAFAAAADGLGWSEGAGVVVAERLADARRLGHQVLAVVAGSAVNSDGASNGLSAPNGPSQQRVIQAALAAAGLSADQVDAVEGHGTGTTLGDPIEAQALIDAYGAGRDAGRPLWLGSVKSNIGHTQQTAGVAGVIKMVQALRHQKLPGTLHVDAPSPHVDWPESVRLLTAAVPWPASGRIRRAGISSFGFSGTNAHLIVADAPASAGRDGDGAGDGRETEAGPAAVLGPSVTPWVVSARTSAGLAAQAERLAAWVTARPGLDPADVAWSLAVTRSAFEHRAVVTGKDRGQLAAGLAALAAREPASGVVTGVTAQPGKTVFVFPGQGGQWAGMGRDLAAACPVFAQKLAGCGAALAPYTGWDLAEVLAQETLPERADVVQPALWAVMVSLAAAWQAAGVTPDAVVGHSQGEIAAATVAGILSLDDAAKVVALRSQALGALSGRGGMASVAEPAEVVRDRIATWGSRLALAAVNGPAATVVSGEPQALDELLAACETAGVRARRVPVDYASHGAQVAELRTEILAALAGVTPGPAAVPMISALTGEWLDGPEADAGYWYESLRAPVEFDRAIRVLAGAGYRLFAELSPHPVLTAAITGTVEDAAGSADSPAPVTVTGTLRRDDGGQARFLAALAEAHVRGARVDWAAVIGPGHRVDLPTYPFQRQRYWPEPSPSATRSRVPEAAWRYEVAWTPVADPGPVVLSGRWLLVIPPGPPGELCARVAGALAGAGADVTALEADQLGAAGPGVHGIVSLVALDESPLPGYPVVPRGLAGTLGLVQALDGVEAPLWVLTRGAVAAGGEPVSSPVQAMAWGLGRVAGLEHPGRWGGLIDLPPEWDGGTGWRLCGALAGCGEDQLAIRGTGITARRVVRAAPRADTGEAWRPAGTVLVTGGTGSIGPYLAGWLARQGAPRVVLVSRSGPGSAGVAELAAWVAGAGTTVTVLTCDIAERSAVQATLATLSTSDPPLRAVFHAAVTIELESLAQAGPRSLAAGLGAKVAGAVVLDELTAGLGLERFVLFSSIAGVWGSSFHGVYAAANAFLDGLASNRRGRGQPATSVAWGVWNAGDVAGAEVPDSVGPASLRRQGLGFLDPGRALAALDRVLAGDETFLAVADVDWARFAPVYRAARPWRLLDELPEVKALAAAGPAAGDSGLAGRLAGLPGPERERVVLDLVRGHAAVVLGHEAAAAIEPGRAFRDLGFDSLTAVELRDRLRAATGLALPSTVVFDYPSAAALAGHLVRLLLGTAAAPVPVRAATARPADPVAIVGLGCRYPGGVSSPQELWELLASGGDAISGFPADRGWDTAAVFDPDPDHPGTSYTRHGGFVADAAGFDPEFFGISPREALAMDPQQRLLLEVAWEAVERAGIDPAALRGSATGVFAGASGSGYGGGLDGAEGHLVTGSATAVISGRVSYALGLEGPAVTVDTACSSSLVAVHLACQALRSGECDLALAGGVMVMVTPGVFAGFSRQRALAADGRCKAFGAGADGMGLAEGAGLILLERLSDARRNGHRVLAVVAGSAVNQDGASNGLTAPNGPSQQRVIAAALASAELDATDIDAVEAHGTGTELGDPIEAQALITAYGPGRQAGRPLWLGSVKSNIGHAQAAAGAAGVIKIVLALEHGVLPATLHAHEPTPHVDWPASVRLLDQAVPWPPAGDRPRRAGVSAFGLSGTNAHLILAEPPAHAASEHGAPEHGPAPLLTAGPVAWPVSATTAAGLAGQAGRLGRYLARRPELDPADVGWSLATTRSVFAHRAVVTGADRAELTAALATLAAGRPAAGVITGPARAPGRLVFVFPGQGSQWAGMGRELAACCPAFAARLAACGRALAPHTSWSLDDVLAAPVLPDRADVVQPALWAVMVSLAAGWAAAGVIPDAVTGHSQGEIAAATVAGILSLDDGARVVARRSRALMALAGHGGMLAVAEPAARVRARIAGWGERLSVAAVNGPSATVVSGEPEALDGLLAVCAQDGIRARPVPVDYASHGAQVESIRPEIMTALAGITPGSGRVPMLSAMTGQWLAGPEAGPAYWYESLRAPVEFERAVRVLAGSGYRMFIEVSPHPVLTPAITETLDEDPADADAGAEDAAAVTGTLRRDDGGASRFTAALAEAWTAGTGVDWSAVLAGGRRVELPTYAFQHQRYWPRASPAPAGGDGAPAAADARFWAAVDGGHAQALAAALAVDERQLTGILPALAAWRRQEQDRSVITGWRYRVTWVPVPAPESAALSGTWLVVAWTGQLAEGLPAGCVRALTAAGAEVAVAEASPDDAGREALATRIRSALTGVPGGGISGVLSLLALREEPDTTDPRAASGLAGTLAVVQALGDAGLDAPLWVVTRGAVAAGPDDRVTSPFQTPVWGLGQVAGLEHPGRWGGLADLPAMLGERSAANLGAVLAGCGEEQVAIRGREILARRLTRAPRPSDRSWTPRGTVLVTGGTGAIGGHVARWLARGGAARLVLASRTGPEALGAGPLAASVAACGAQVRVLACDNAARAEVAGLLAGIGADGPPLTAVLHAAGTGQATAVADTTQVELASVLAAKAAGAAWLDELTAGTQLDAFVLFSSASATWGSGRQPAYAAANAFLDGLAENRRARGLPATSVAWGLWGGGGLADGETGTQLQRRGLREMDPDLAVQALRQALADGEPLLTVADVDWARFVPAYTLARPRPLITGLPEVRQVLDELAEAADEAGPPGTPTAFEQRLASLPRAEQGRVVRELIRAEAAVVLGLSSGRAVGVQRPFRELGFDSLTAIELRNRLTAATGWRLPATLIFDYPTPDVLAGHLLAESCPAEAAAGESALAGIDTLESALSGLTADDEARAAITARLQTLLSRWVNGQGGEETAAVTTRLRAATADEVLDFIDKELGMSLSQEGPFR